MDPILSKIDSESEQISEYLSALFRPLIIPLDIHEVEENEEVNVNLIFSTNRKLTLFHTFDHIFKIDDAITYASLDYLYSIYFQIFSQPYRNADVRFNFLNVDPGLGGCIEYQRWRYRECNSIVFRYENIHPDYLHHSKIILVDNQNLLQSLGNLNNDIVTGYNFNDQVLSPHGIQTCIVHNHSQSISFFEAIYYALLVRTEGNFVFRPSKFPTNALDIEAIRCMAMFYENITFIKPLLSDIDDWYIVCLKRRDTGKIAKELFSFYQELIENFQEKNFELFSFNKFKSTQLLDRNYPDDNFVTFIDNNLTIIRHIIENSIYSERKLDIGNINNLLVLPYKKILHEDLEDEFLE